MLDFPDRHEVEEVAREFIIDTTAKVTRQKLFAEYHSDEVLQLDQESQIGVPLRDGEVMEEALYPIMMLAKKDSLYLIYGVDATTINPYETLFAGVAFQTHPEDLHRAMGDFLSSKEIRKPLQFRDNGGDYALWEPEIDQQIRSLDQRDDVFFRPPAKIIQTLLQRIKNDDGTPIAVFIPKGILIGDNSLGQLENPNDPNIPIYNYRVTKFPNLTMVDITEISHFWEP